MTCSGPRFAFRTLNKGVLDFYFKCSRRSGPTIRLSLIRNPPLVNPHCNASCYLNSTFLSYKKFLIKLSFCKNLLNGQGYFSKCVGAFSSLLNTNVLNFVNELPRRPPFVARTTSHRRKMPAPPDFFSLSNLWYLLGIVVLLLSYQNLCFDYYGTYSIVPYLILVPLVKEVIEVDIAEISKWWLIVALYPSGALSVGLTRMGVVWLQLYTVEVFFKKIFEVYRDYHILKNFGYLSYIALILMSIPATRPLAILQLSLCNQIHPRAKYQKVPDSQRSYYQLCLETGSILSTWNALLAPDTQFHKVKILPQIVPITHEDLDSTGNLSEASKVKFQSRLFPCLVSQIYSVSRPCWSILHCSFFDLALFVESTFGTDIPEKHLINSSDIKDYEFLFDSQ